MTDKMVWGPSHFPIGAESLGVIKHPVDGQLGVLFKLQSGLLAHGTDGVLRSIEQNPAAILGRKGGSVRSEAKSRAAVERNAKRRASKGNA